MKPILPTARPLTHVIAATLACIVAFALLGGVATLFQRDGIPLERLVVTEHACAGLVDFSQREACKRRWPAATRALPARAA